jgi:hypothetical protein
MKRGDEQMNGQRAIFLMIVMVLVTPLLISCEPPGSTGVPATVIVTAPSLEIEDAWVELWDDKGFKDRKLTIRYPKYHKNLKMVSSDDGKEGFNDKASAVRWEIPKGWQAVLYDDADFKDRRHVLIGTGRLEENPDLGSFSDKTSSIRWERTQ